MCFGWYDKKNAHGDNPTIVPPAEITFQITGTKLYVPVVTLSKENDIKRLDQVKLGFKRTIKWNKYRSQLTIQPQNNNLTDPTTDPTLTNVNRLFVLSFARNNAGDKRVLFHIIMHQTLKLKTSMS